MGRVTAQDVKQSNYLNIYRLFFQHNLLSKPQIARLLNLSLPTVVNNVSALEAEGKIQENGMCAPQGGRPAIAYQLVKDSAVAIGVEIQSKGIKCAVINLKGDISTVNYFMLNFENSMDYIRHLCRAINEFIANQVYQDSHILGVGISFQGIANKDGQTILYGKILPYDYLNVSTLQPYLDYPVILLHDVKCAANAELWHAKQYIYNAVYISISEHLGGALILNNQIDQGKQGYSGALEHFRVNDNGKLCYCGQIGCLETHCSLTALLESGESLEHFFLKLRTDDQPTYSRWHQFLTYLAKALNYVYLLLERDIILGGEIAPYLRDEDLTLLSRLVENHAPFPLSGQFIRVAALQQNAALIGAGLPFIRTYIP